MNAILPIIAETPIGADLVQTVRGRDVHAFLEIGKDYSTWMRAQIERARLQQGRDFVIAEGSEVFPQKGGNSGSQGVSGGRPRVEHHLTLDAAKHVGMMSGTDRGHDLREYFLECERKAKGVSKTETPSIPKTYAEALQAAADLARQVEAQSAEIAVLGPRSEALAVIADADGTYAITDAAKTLQMSPGELRDWLFRNQWVYRRDRDGSTVAYQSKILAGYMVHKAVAVPTAGRPWIKSQARVTTKGLAALAQRIPLDRPGGLFGPTAPAA